MEAEQKKERAEKQLAERNSEFIKEKGEFVLKKNVDSETIKRQQKELNGLRKYMETAERHWDLLSENLLDVGALLDAVSGYDTTHRPAEGSSTKNSRQGGSSWQTRAHTDEHKRAQRGSPRLRNPELSLPGPAPRMLPKRNPRTEEEESEEDVSSPAEDAKEKDPEGDASPSKAE
ncbi:hypothetical protein QYE76_051198 [Lolium multiflorum]|uniref:Uncharacterized protein n=1 Tax=Lolium multiflorum TaxID=4521 RepID=A0AAD8WHZ0_LOLMU|nr:hypothetical protein QYE76_051198 [Lolium multiflorum]